MGKWCYQTWNRNGIKNGFFSNITFLLPDRYYFWEKSCNRYWFFGPNYIIAFIDVLSLRNKSFIFAAWTVLEHNPTIYLRMYPTDQIFVTNASSDSWIFALLYLPSDSTTVPLADAKLSGPLDAFKKGSQITSFLSILKKDDILWNPATQPFINESGPLSKFKSSHQSHCRKCI